MPEIELETSSIDTKQGPLYVLHFFPYPEPVQPSSTVVAIYQLAAIHPHFPPLSSPSPYSFRF